MKKTNKQIAKISTHVRTLSSVFRWLALYLSFKAAHRLHHRRLWSADEGDGGDDGRKAGSSVSSGSCLLSNRDLILWPDRTTSFPNMHNSAVLRVSRCDALCGKQEYIYIYIISTAAPYDEGTSSEIRKSLHIRGPLLKKNIQDRDLFFLDDFLTFVFDKR